jgi:hypothetical protein
MVTAAGHPAIVCGEPVEPLLWPAIAAIVTVAGHYWPALIKGNRNA